MVNKKDLKEFAEFCQVKYKIELNPAIIEDFIQTLYSNGEMVTEIQNFSEHHHIEGCSSNNIDCTHLTFDSAKCIECPY